MSPVIHRKKLIRADAVDLIRQRCALMKAQTVPVDIDFEERISRTTAEKIQWLIQRIRKEELEWVIRTIFEDVP